MSIKKYVGKRGITYQVRVERTDPVTGKRKQIMKTLKTKKDAEAFERRWDTDKAQGGVVDPSKMTVGEYLHYWLTTTAKPNIRDTTYESYEMLIRVHITPALGAVPLQKLTALQIQDFYTTMLASGRADGRGASRALSPRTVRYAHAVLRRALKQAERWDMVLRNVADRVDPPKGKRPQVEVWTAPEVKCFLDIAEADSTYGPVWLTALTTGLRRGELLGLRWCDVDLASAQPVLRVHKSYVALKVKPSMHDVPKTGAGRRTITISARCAAALRSHRAAQPVPIDAAQRDQGLVFTAENGQPINPHNLNRKFAQLIDKVGVKRISVHGMRHTHATHLLLAGVPVKQVSERLGHASIAITLDTYAHVLPQMQAHAAEAIDLALFGVTRTGT